MANAYRDPTANQAIGSVDKEISRMRRKAQKLKELRRSGRLTPELEAQARREFVGIYRRILREALEDTPNKGA